MGKWSPNWKWAINYHGRDESKTLRPCKEYRRSGNTSPPKIQDMEYYDAVLKIASSLVIIADNSGDYDSIKNTVSDLALESFNMATTMLEADHVSNLSFIIEDGSTHDYAIMWRDFRCHHTITNYDSVIAARQKRGDNDLMKEVAEKLVNIMPELTTEFWAETKK